MIYCFLAGGFEEIEAIAPIDILRRAELDVTVVGIGGLAVVGSHGIAVGADITDSEVGLPDDIEAVILPGGMPGTLNLGKHEGLCELLKKHYEAEKMIAAICAAPSVFGQLGFLNGRIATCYPGFESKLEGAIILSTKVAVDGNVTTSKGLGTAIDFSLKLIEQLTDLNTAMEISEGIMYSL